MMLWSQLDPPAALAAWTERDIPLNEWVDQHLVGNLAQHDPYAAFDWVLAQPTSSRRQYLLRSALSEMAKVAPRDALDRAQELRSNEREQSIDAVLSEWARSDHRAAARWIAGADTLSQAELRSALHSVLHVWGEADAPAALNWLLAQPQSWHEAASSVISALADDAPERAARLVERLSDPEVRSSARSTLVSHWADSDPRAAVRWVGAVADAEERRGLYADVFRAWAREDRDAAAQSIRLLRAGKDRDAVRCDLVQTVVYEDVDFAEELYLRINDADELRQAAASLYHYWEDRDPQRARRYQRAAGLDDERG